MSPFDTCCFGGGLMSPGSTRDGDGHSLFYGRKGASSNSVRPNTRQERAARLLAKELAWGRCGQGRRKGKKLRGHQKRLERLQKAAKS